MGNLLKRIIVLGAPGHVASKLPRMLKSVLKVNREEKRGDRGVTAAPTRGAVQKEVHSARESALFFSPGGVVAWALERIETD